jgi:hypothetical protein
MRTALQTNKTIDRPEEIGTIIQCLYGATQISLIALLSNCDQETETSVRASFDSLWDRRIATAENERFRAPVGSLFSDWFLEALPPIEKRKELRRAGLFLYLYIVMQDDIVDGEVEPSAANTFLAKVLRTEALGSFLNTVPSNRCKEVANQFERADRRMLASDHRLVAKYSSEIGLLAPDLDATVGKCCLLKMTGFVSAIICNQPDVWKDLNRAYDLLAIGNAFCDDLKDWKMDLGAGQNTLVIALAKEKLGEIENFNPTKDQLEVAIFSNEIAGFVTAEAVSYIEKSVNIFSSLGCVTWAEFGNQLLDGISKLTVEFERNEPESSILACKAVMEKKFHST